MRSRTICLPLVALMLALSFPNAARGQAASGPVYDLSAREIRTHYLEVAAPTVTSSFFVDDASLVTITFGSVSKTLHIELTSPDGSVFASTGASTPQCEISVVADPASPETGALYEFRLVDPQVGSWSYSVVDTAGTSLSRAVLFSILTNSPVQATMLGGGQEYRAGDAVQVAAVAVESPNILRNLTITPMVERTDGEAFTPPTVVFADDGQGADGTANDGLYSAEFVLTSPAEYLVSAVIQGTTSQGHTFGRTVSALVTVHPNRADLLGTFSSRGIDTNGDGLLDAIGVSPDVTVFTAGDYSLTVTLGASNGNTVSAHGDVSLSQGTHAPEVSFSADEIRQGLQVDGPYAVKAARIYFENTTTTDLADQEFDLGSTQAFLLSQLQREASELLPGGTAAGIDTDSNGKFDRLDVNLPVRFLNAGTYHWSADIAPKTGATVVSASGSGFFTPGGANLHLSFDGMTIGLSGIDGPYVVRNLRILGTGGSTTVAEALITPNYAASRFENCRVTCPADVTVAASPGACGATVTYPGATTQGVCETLNYSPASGAVFPIGSTTVTVSSPSGGNCSFTVTVNATPFTASNNGPLSSGQTLQLTADPVSGGTYSWTGPNGFTSSEQNPSIAGATVSASGTYTVVFTSAGCTSQTTTAVVVNPTVPSIVQHPANTTICLGESTAFTASATSDSPVTVQWQYSTNYGGTWANVAGGTSTELTVAGVTSTRSYRAVFTNSYGSMATEWAILTIVTVPAIGTQPAAGAALCAGDTLQLTVSASSGETNTYQWRKDGVPLSNGVRVTGATGYTLKILQMGSGDAGSYDVQVTSRCGTTTSSASTVTVAACSGAFNSSFASSIDAWEQSAPIGSGTWALATAAGPTPPAGGYYANTTSTQGGWTSASYVGGFENFDYEVEIARTGTCTTCADSLYVRGAPTVNGAIGPAYTWRTGYEFSIRRDGSYSVWRRNHVVAATALQPWTVAYQADGVTPLITWASGAINTVRVVADGETLHFMINGQEVFVVTDTTLPSGRVGVAAYRVSTNNGLADVVWVNNARLDPVTGTPKAGTSATPGNQRRWRSITPAQDQRNRTAREAYERSPTGSPMEAPAQ